MVEQRDEETWANETFADAELGDARRTRRLIRVAAAVAKNPAGTVTKALRNLAEREGAYRLLENDQVSPEVIARAVGAATARNCRDHDWVYVPLDQTTLSVVDRKKVRGLGRVADGTFETCRGLEVINSLAVGEDGQTLGLAAMRWWARPDERVGKRAPEERESQVWLDVLADTEEQFREHAPNTTLWYQLDAGADHARTYRKVIELGHHVTIRSAHNRIIQTPEGPGKLWDEVSRQRLLGKLDVERKGKGLKRYRACLSVRACAVKVMFFVEGSSKREPVAMWVVQVREVGRRPKGYDAICWNLLTTYQVDNFEDAQEVVTGYKLRWRIEDFYRTWKRGHCRLEDSQLRSEGAFMRWAIILGAVAARIEHIKHRSRTEPKAPALSEFSRDEIDAAIILSETNKWQPGDEPELGAFVELVARLGGYTGKSSGGPPGSVTIGRGLDFITPGVMILRRTRPEGCG